MTEQTARESYVKATLNTLLPAQIRALRLRDGYTQVELAEITGMKQARISAAETPGAVNFSLETLVRIAAAFRIGLQVRFLSYSQMLTWENDFSQDHFSVTKIEDDAKFLESKSKNELQKSRSLTDGECRALDPSRFTKAISKEDITSGEQYAPHFSTTGESFSIRGLRVVESGRTDLLAGFSGDSGGSMPFHQVS